MTNDSLASGVDVRTVSRRDFLVSLVGGLSVGFTMGSGDRALAIDPAAAVVDSQVNSYVRVATNGEVTLLFGGAEMGQGSMSGLAQILAEELMVDWNQITVEQAPASKISYLTGGSGAIKGRYTPLRTAGAAARELLVAAAMLATGDTTRASYAVKSGAVTYTAPDGKSMLWGYGDLAVAAAGPAAQALLPNSIPLTDPANFRIIGQSVARVDIPLKVNGSAKYGIDVWSPDMVFGVIKHCPTIGGVLAKTPTKPASAIAVVPVKASDNRGAVVAGTYNAVAVIADNTWKAKKIAKSLSVAWSLPASTANVDSASLATQAKALMATGTALVADTSLPTATSAEIKTQVSAALTASAKKVGGTFSVPYLAHATMEVLNCTAKVTFNGATPVSCEVWAPNQAANSVVATATAITGLPATAITVHTTFLGGGLGRKIEQDYISQTIQVAMVVQRPVKLTWMREEDFGHDNYRPMALVQADAGLDSANKVAAWSYRTVTPSITAQRGRLAAGTVDSQAVEGAVRLPYNLGTKLVEWVPFLDAGIPVGYWRSVGCSINTFVSESMIDLLAKAAGQDPFTFRYGTMTDARGVAVLAAADQASQWRKTLVKGHAWGVAISQAFNTWVCEVFEISAPTSTSIRVHRVTCVVDCGQVINPNSVTAQMEGGIIHGINAAMWGQITFTQGIAAQTNFNKNRMMRMNEAPQIDVQIIKSTLPPTGTGEPGVPPVAPAIANAYAALTGKRLTALPFFPGATMGGL